MRERAAAVVQPEVAELPPTVEELLPPEEVENAVTPPEAILEAIPEAMPETADAADAEGAPDDGEGAGFATIYLNLGRRDGVRASEVTKLLRERCGLGRRDIGRVRVRDKHTFVGVPSDKIDEIVRTLAGQSVFDKELVVEPARASRQ